MDLEDQLDAALKAGDRADWRIMRIEHALRSAEQKIQIAEELDDPDREDLDRLERAGKHVRDAIRAIGGKL